MNRPRQRNSVKVRRKQLDFEKGRRGCRWAAACWEGSGELSNNSALLSVPFDSALLAYVCCHDCSLHHRHTPPPRNMGGWVSCTEIWARGRVYSSLHHFTMSDQRKKWVSGVGGREKGGLWGRERKELCQGNVVGASQEPGTSEGSCQLQV